ncbi:MAG: 50S ribosomal protein L22 [Clostridiales bacterium]|nr:50S ribosomal protein L22 [Clostridiales bacterium]MDE6060611.1 50S ribosomal protein L22 [Clostridia bacterium]
MATRSKQKALERQAKADTRPCATAKYVRISPYKVRIVLDIIKGKSVTEAIAILENTPKAASEVLLKVVNSAAANAENNQNLARNDLYIAECYANEGPTLKRIQAVSKGRAYRINKRTSHVTVVLDSMA